MRTPTKRLSLLSLLSFLGFVISTYQTTQFYTLRNGTGGFKSICTFGVFNCDAIESSRYAELFHGIPLSAAASSWFLGFLVITLFARNSNWVRDSVRALFAMSLVGVATSAVYLYIMLTVLKAYCLFCLGVDSVNILLLLTVLTLKPEGTSKHSLDFNQWKIFAGILVGSLIVNVAIGYSMDKVTPPQSEIKTMVDEVISRKVYPVQTENDFPSIGPHDAPVTIVKFSDFQCPHCKWGALTIHPLLYRFKDKVRFILRFFPLDASCNRMLTHPMHEAACEAARVAYCANKQGKFEEVYESLFEHQQELQPGHVRDFAQMKDVDQDQMNNCVDAQSTKDAIARDLEEGFQLGIQSTPTFFVNGHKIEGSLSSPVWVDLIERLLKSPQ